MNLAPRPTNILSSLVAKIQIQLAQTLYNNMRILNPFLSANVRSSGIKESEIDSIMTCLTIVANCLTNGINDGYFSQPNNNNIVYVNTVNSSDVDTVSYLKISGFILGILFVNPLIAAEALFNQMTTKVILLNTININALSDEAKTLIIKNSADIQATTDYLTYIAAKKLSDSNPLDLLLSNNTIYASQTKDNSNNTASIANNIYIQSQNNVISTINALNSAIKNASLASISLDNMIITAQTHNNIISNEFPLMPAILLTAGNIPTILFIAAINDLTTSIASYLA